MSTDINGKTGGLFANPLPMVMVALLAGSVLVKNVPLESARPVDPERVKFVPTARQDVEARLWQDPFAAIENHVQHFTQVPGDANALKAHNHEVHSTKALKEEIKEISKYVSLTVVAVNVFGDSFDEAAESRRRWRLAVISALGFHQYYPEETDRIGYFNTELSEFDGHSQQLPVAPSSTKISSESSPNSDSSSLSLAVPFEWYERKELKGQPSKVLVLWLDETKLTTAPLAKLRNLFNQLADKSKSADESKSVGESKLNIKLIGPAGSNMLENIFNEQNNEQNNEVLNNGTLKIFSPGATVSNCELSPNDSKKDLWGCIQQKEIPPSKDGKKLPIVRTTGTDDILSVSLLWELWQRGVNRDFGYGDKKSASSKRTCKDGVVLISEQSSSYARVLSKNLTDGFSSLCGSDTNASKQISTFTYLRGLDGVLPDIDKSGVKASNKNKDEKAKDLHTQLQDVPKEHAEGRSQYDYLRRLGEEIERLDSNPYFAKNGVRAIGIIGNDVYDKLLILQALRSRFGDKIFFTTDLDARYLHADQQSWARNLVVASNFGLTLRPELQHMTLPFRDSYQTATYLATLMALEDKTSNLDWSAKMKDWLHPQLFEIGRTEAVHLASPTVEDLTRWYNASRIEGTKTEGVISKKENTDIPCDEWVKCEGIEPVRFSHAPSHLKASLLIAFFVFLLIALVSRYIHETWPVAKNWLCPSDMKFKQSWLKGLFLLALAGLIIGFPFFILDKMNSAYEQGIGEPFRWLEGVSVWPSLVLRYICLVFMLVFMIASWISINREAFLISEDFKLDMPKMTWTLVRSSDDFKLDSPKAIWTLVCSKVSAICNGPFVDLALFNREGKAGTKKKGSRVEIAILWQNYMRSISLREMSGWILLSLVIVFLMGVAIKVNFPDQQPSFPHRGQLVECLKDFLVIANALILWVLIFGVIYQSRACAQFIKIMNKGDPELPNQLLDYKDWPEELLKKAEGELGVPREYLADYLGFELVRRATQRIRWLIYLPFVSILFVIVARSDLIDAMNFPPSLIFVSGLALTFALSSEIVLHRCAMKARIRVLARYKAQLMRILAMPNDNLKGSSLSGMASGEEAVSTPLKNSSASTTERPIGVDQIKLLVERIRNTQEGVFAPIYEQPALRAVLLPFGGFGGAQLIEYFISLKV